MILELMARGGMGIGEVLKLKPVDVDGQKLIDVFLERHTIAVHHLLDF